MREELRPALQILVPDLAAQAGGIDVHQDEILPAVKSLIGDPHDLPGIRAVDEPFRGE